MNYDIKISSYPIPEALENAIRAGFFDDAKAIIDNYLEKDIPSPLRERLNLERGLIDRRASSYPYSYEEAEHLLKENFPNYSEGMLSDFIHEGLLDWIYIEGKIYLEERIIENAKRRIPLFKEEGESRDLVLRDEFISRLEKEGSVETRITLKETLLIKGEKYKGKVAHINMPLAKKIDNRLYDIDIIEISEKNAIVDSEDAPKRTVSFDKILKGDDEISITFSYTIKEEKRELPKDGGYLAPNMAEYLKEEGPHILFTPYLKELAKEITKDSVNMVEKAEAIYRFITERVLYSFVRPYATYSNISEFVASSLKGDCGMQALLFITLCRISKIPACWESGWYVTPMEVGNHDWAKINISGIWYPVDCSFGGGAYRSGNLKRQKHYFGHLDTFRMIANTSNFDTLTGKRSYASDPTDNQSGEVEVENETLLKDEWALKREVVSYIYRS